MQPAPQTQQIFIRSGFDPFGAAAYLFDIDGTLLNTRDGVHWNAFRTALREVFAIESVLDTVPVHGNTDIGILRAVTEQRDISHAEFELRLPRALDIMRAQVATNCRQMQCEVCPGIPGLLETLGERGKILGVVSGNLESIGWKKVEAAGLREFFAFGSFSDGTELREGIFRNGLSHAQRLIAEQSSTDHWPPTTHHCVFIGDTPADVAAARVVGVPVIAVATGTYKFGELLASSPDVCVPCCSDLLRWQP